MAFTHLHVHSDFSLLQGLAKIDDLLAETKKNNMTALALTDRYAIYGAVDFCVAAKDQGIKPIVGAEVLVAPGGMMNKGTSPTDRKTNQIVLLAENEAGYKNILKIITIGQLEGFYYKPRVDYDVLKKHSEGIIALSGNQYGEVAENILHDAPDQAEKKARLYEEIFGKENFFLEINHHPDYPDQNKINDGIIALSKKTDIPLVACGDIYYITPEDRESHDILICIGMNRKVDEGDRPNYNHLDLSFRSEEFIREAFKDVPEAIDNTGIIADRCQFEMEVGNTKLPYYPLPEGKTADEHLRDMCEEGLLERYGSAENITDLHRERMDYELDIIKRTGYASYFLIVQDFTNWSRDNGIVVGPGRGSAAGSFVSYLVKITNMDPIEYKLLFERFLNPERVSMPDVDMDFADIRRDDVLQYCRDTYGSDHVAQIITFGTMAARAAVRDAGRALGFPYDFCDKISKLIPMFYSMQKTLDEVPDFKRLYEENVDARTLIDAAHKLEGLNRHSSIHACGVVITDKPVVEYTALQRVSGDDEALVTQYASSTKFSAVEKIGLLKMDFLGLKNLTIIQNTIKIVKRIHGVEIDIEHIDLDDQKAFELLQKGQTTGVFQLESSGMKRYLKQLKPTILEDIIAMVALYRPGPMEWIPDFIDGKHGRKEVTYLDPKLEAILSDTYGVAVYQEQVMRIAQDLAGFTLGEADILRKAMGKKILELIKEQKIKFVAGCVEHGIEKQIAEDVFAFIEPFAGYGFNRSHAACYGLIGYQTAFLKAHYPAEFMAALMTSDQGNTDRIAIDAYECREMGIEVLPPHINESFEEFAVIYDEGDTKKEFPRIRFGLNAIKNVGHAVAYEIVEERKKNGPFTDFTDFFERISSKDLNKRSIEALAMVGGFEGLAERNQILQNMPNILAFVKSTQQDESAQDSLFGAGQLARATVQLKASPPAKKKTTLEWEKALLGLYVSDHPARAYESYFSSMCAHLKDFTEDRARELDEVAETIGGIVMATTTILLKSGKTMAFVTLEDGTGSIECLVFPKLYEEFSPLLRDGEPIVVRGKFTGKDDELKFIADHIEEISPDDNTQAKRIAKTKKRYKKDEVTTEDEDDIPARKVDPNDTYTIELPAAGNVDIIDKIKKVLDSCEEGTTTIYLLHNGTRIKTSYIIYLSDVDKDKIESVLKP